MTAVSSGELNVQGKQFGGEAVFSGHMDDDFIAEVQVKLNSGKDAAIYFRYLDPDNWYRARLQGTPVGAVFLEKMHKGKLTTLDSAAAFPSDPDVLRVKCVGSTLEVWYNPAGTPGAATLSATDGDIGWGGVALSGWDALFDNLKVGYDADDDDDLDGSDDVVIDEDFSSTSVSPTHDDAGNLTKDADYAYVYDGWNNLVKVRAQNDADVVVGVYAYYADNRRASKTVTNRGDLDGVTYFFYDGLREIEERNGSEQVTQQYVWGHEYLDQLLMIRGAGGTWFVHQDANWNVIALTTPNGDVAEEVQYQPYGLPQVKRHLAFGDSDADGDVDASDNTARTNALSTYNRAFDADFDGDVSNTSGDADQLAWEASYNDPAASTTMVIPNRGFSPSGNPFLFTGRRLDAETGLYFYRFRTYHPTLKTFLQRDPLGYGDSASLYQYVGGRPTAAGDPLGLFTWVGDDWHHELPKEFEWLWKLLGIDSDAPEFGKLVSWEYHRGRFWKTIHNWYNAMWRAWINHIRLTRGRYPTPEEVREYLQTMRAAFSKWLAHMRPATTRYRGRVISLRGAKRIVKYIPGIGWVLLAVDVASADNSALTLLDYFTFGLYRPIQPTYFDPEKMITTHPYYDGCDPDAGGDDGGGYSPSPSPPPVFGGGDAVY